MGVCLSSDSTAPNQSCEMARVGSKSCHQRHCRDAPETPHGRGWIETLPSDGRSDFSWNSRWDPSHSDQNPCVPNPCDSQDPNGYKLSYHHAEPGTSYARIYHDGRFLPKNDICVFVVNGFTCRSPCETTIARIHHGANVLIQSVGNRCPHELCGDHHAGIQRDVLRSSQSVQRWTRSQCSWPVVERSCQHAADVWLPPIKDVVSLLLT